MTKWLVLPCPFCGAAPTIEYWHGGGPKKTAVHCDDESCSASPMVTGGTTQVAVRRWNTRGNNRSTSWVEKRPLPSYLKKEPRP